ncbi:urease accessory protein UreD [Amorphus sp. 3PC139-8]|uniref:urease accessory protein UreD n=1 Tax=Amorphus sp. 3PC139-8 TaxID=2735676 RepID=UPI00345DEE8B
MDAKAPGGDATISAGPRPRLERVSGRLQLRTKRSDADGGTAIDQSRQEGSFKVRYPRLYDGAGLEAVVLNTAGGVTDGDRFALQATAVADTHLTLTTQAAERVYRALDGEARLDVRLAAEAGATLFWLPQETILYDGGRLARSFDISFHPSARILLCEMVVLGRTAHGETVREGLLTDRWRVRRGGALVYADALRLDGAIAERAGGPATLSGARAFASLVWVAPDAEERLDALRALFDDPAMTAGASAWDGMLAIRLVAADAARLRAMVTALVAHLAGTVPRVWAI